MNLWHWDAIGESRWLANSVPLVDAAEQGKENDVTTLYKLTTQDDFTRKGCSNETRWGEGVTHTAPGHGELCTEAYIHAYTSPLLAVFMNPVHGNFHNPKLWQCEGTVENWGNGTKVGCTSLTTEHTIPLPSVTTTQRVAFGILCALEVNNSDSFKKWAYRWLAGEDRGAADAAANANAAYAAACAAAYAATYAANAAANAACAAACATLDLIALAEKAMQYH